MGEGFVLVGHEPITQVIEAAREHAEAIKTRQRRIDERLAERRGREEEQKREDAARTYLEARATFLQTRVRVSPGGSIVGAGIASHQHNCHEQKSKHRPPRVVQLLRKGISWSSFPHE